MWPGISLVGDIEGFVDPLRIRAIQLLYAHSSESPTSALAVTTSAWHRHLHSLSPPNWFVNFLGRVDPAMIEQRLRARRVRAFDADEFTVTRERAWFLNQPTMADHYVHNDLPFEACGFLQGVGHAVGGWGESIMAFIPLLHTLGI